MIWLLLALCLFLSFMLSGMESALFTVSRVRARHAASEGDKNARRLNALLEHRNNLLHTITAINHFVTLIAFALATFFLLRWLGAWGWAVSVLLALPVFIIGLELVPKILFQRYPFRLLCRLATPLTVLHTLTKPWLWFVNQFRQKSTDTASPDDTTDDIHSLVKTLRKLGVLTESIASLVEQLAKFQKLQASDLMIPLSRLTALPPDMPLASVMQLNHKMQHPWRAVMGSDGALLGWLDVTSLPAKPMADKLVRQFMRPLSQIHLHDPALRCLQMIRKRGEPVAEVRDEMKQVVGLISQPTLINAMLGEVLVKQ